MAITLLFWVCRYHILATEWPGRQCMLFRLLSHHCPFRCQDDRTDDVTLARRPTYCQTVPVVSHGLLVDDT